MGPVGGQFHQNAAHADIDQEGFDGLLVHVNGDAHAGDVVAGVPAPVARVA
jgi:hypothetical protein